MTEEQGITKWFGGNLGKLLGEKLKMVSQDFDSQKYAEVIEQECKNLSYTARIELHADTLHEYLQKPYPQAIKILLSILGEENKNETGMFTHFYWIMPIGKFIEKYGLDDFDISMQAIEEITKRNTGEYAIRPFLRTYPEKTISVMEKWSKSKNFHLRRLSSEGSRPKLPWSTKLDTFIENPAPVFKILRNLMKEECKFVQKSVANNITDYLKVNKKAATAFIEEFRNLDNKNTQWIIHYATRKIKV